MMRKVLWAVAVLVFAALLLSAVVEAHKPWWYRDLTGPAMPKWLWDLMSGRWGGSTPTPQPAPLPIPLPVPRRPTPSPCPGPNCPTPRPKRWGPESVGSIGALVSVNGRVEASGFTIGGPALDGVEVACDLPHQRHQRNTGGSDGAGLCVPTSCAMAADWHGLNPLVKLQEWCKRRPGGSNPQKLKSTITQFCQEVGMPEPPYLQVTNGDESILEEANEHRIMLAVTYSGRDGVYYRGTVPHMVCLVAFNREKDRAAILDNNYPGQLLWMRCREFTDRWKTAGGGGWAVAFLLPPPPPIPISGPRVQEFAMTAQCPTCPPPAYVSPAPALPPPAASATSSSWEWKRGQASHGQTDLWGLYRGNQQVGVYQTSRDVFYSLNEGQLSENTPPVPVPVSAWPPAGTHRGSATAPLFGVEVDQVRGSAAYEVNGRAVTRDQLIGAIHNERLLPAVRGKPWIVIAGGTEQQRAAVVADLDALPERNRFLVSSYAQGEWPLDVGIQASGTPSIQFLGPEDAAGKAMDLGRFDAHPGKEHLAEAVVEAVRKADPSYQPQLRRPASGSELDPTVLIIAAALVIAVIVLVPRRR